MLTDVPLFSVPCGFFRLSFYPQEYVRITEDRMAILLDVQCGKGLVLICEGREPGQHGLLELPIDQIKKQYD